MDSLQKKFKNKKEYWKFTYVILGILLTNR